MKTWGVERHQRGGGGKPPTPDKPSTVYTYAHVQNVALLTLILTYLVRSYLKHGRIFIAHGMRTK